LNPARKIIVFDIETAPLPEPEIAKFMPVFSAPANFKDPEKIQQAIDTKKIEWAMEAALSPVTGRIDAIGYVLQEPAITQCQMVGDKEFGTETEVIKNFWAMVSLHSNYEFVGFNIKRFDLPFLVRRSWKLGITIPAGIRGQRYWGDQFVDLMEVWQLGNNQEYMALDRLAKFMGLPGKAGTGADFHKMDPEQKRQYLETDLELTKALAERMLV